MLSPLQVNQYLKLNKYTNKIRGEREANLAVPRGDGLGVVPAVEAVDAVLELLADQGLVLPAAVRVRKAHPLAQVLWLVGGGFAAVRCMIHRIGGGEMPSGSEHPF